MSLRQVLQGFRHFGQNFNRMIRNSVGKAVDLGVQLRRDRFNAQALESVDQRMRETVQAITVFHDAFALHVIEHFAHLLGRELVVIQKRDEAGDGPLEVNVVLPERVVGVDEEGLGDKLLAPSC